MARARRPGLPGDGGHRHDRALAARGAHRDPRRRRDPGRASGAAGRLSASRAVVQPPFVRVKVARPPSAGVSLRVVVRAVAHPQSGP